MTLTQAAFWTRRGSVIFAGVVIFLTILVFIYLNLPGQDPIPNYLTANYRCTESPETFVAEKLSIPTKQLAAGSEGLIEISTPTGRIEQLPLIANVYEYVDRGPTLTAQSQARDIADRLGLDPAGLQRTSATQYNWSPDQFGRRLQVDARTLNFTMSVDFSSPVALPDEKELPSDSDAINIARVFLRSNGWMLDDYSEEEPYTTNINVLPNGSFSEARSRAEAELIRVDFVRSIPFLKINATIEDAERIRSVLEEEYFDYETVTSQDQVGDEKVDFYDFTTQIVNSNTQKSNISVYVGTEDERKESGQGNPSIYGVEYYAYEVDTQECGTYPLISATQVTDIILNGNASLVYLNERNGDNVVDYTPKNVRQFAVTDVRLVYLDTAELQRFMQPIYLVSGEATFANGELGTFYYYIPAIDYENIQYPIPDTETVDDESGQPTVEDVEL